MRVLDSQSLVDTMDQRSNDYAKLRSQLETLQKTFQVIVQLDSFVGQGADAIKGFYKAHMEVIDALFLLIDCQIAFFEGVKHKLVSEKLGADTVVHSSFLEDELSKSERQAADMADQYRSELNSIFQKINDILSLQVFSTSDFQVNLEDAQMNREKTIEVVERVDQELLNEYMYSIYEQDNAQALFQALRDATTTGVRIQPISFDAKAFRASEIYQLQGGAKFHTDTYLRLKNKELEEMGIQTNTRYEANGNHDEFNLAEFSGYYDILRARYGFDPVTGLELRLDERLNYALLTYIRFGSRPVVEDRENHEAVKLTKEEFEAIQQDPVEIVNVIDEMKEYSGDYYVYGNGLTIRVFGNVREKVDKIPPDRVGGGKELDTFFEGTPLAILEYVMRPKTFIKKSINNIVKKQVGKGDAKLSPSNYPNPDPPMSIPPVRYEPKTIEEVIRMRQGKGPTTKMTHGDKNIEAHHRQQVPVKNGGILDELEQRTHRGGGNHTRHEKPSQLTPSQRAKEIREHYKERGKGYILPGEGI
ncbi:T7SS effector LXG polymorphic toxin [Metabacillus litoralis]|uniref:T7SS effector LXG polymorphic toxin n=1 Tax=Metabacillus litoralis TaxID=152268 RepID=UPI000EF610FC|nr:T7SS effector LXG polymorphic toxin [Metabacillus litoralis]